MPATYNDLYLDARRALKAAGVEQAQLEARELLCRASGKTREDLLRDLPLYAPDGVTARFQGLMARRMAGEPVAYLIGEWEFYGLTLDVCRDVLIPRMDTELLAERGILRTRGAGEGARVLDLCAGSGCVGLAVAAQVSQSRAVLGEWSDGALRICRQNIRRNNLTGRVVPVKMDARSLPDRGLGEFDCIICNPPYIPTADIETLDGSVRDYEPRMALDGGPDGLAFYRDITEKWRDSLTAGGRLYFEVGIGQAATVRAMMRAGEFEDVTVVPDTGGIDRVVYGTLAEII